MSHRLERVVQAWNAVQVELQGRYSIPRLHALHRFELSSSVLQSYAIAVVTPLPVLVLIVLVELLPLRATNEGLPRSVGFWSRSFITTFYLAFMAIVFIRRGTPTLAMSTVRMWIISVSAGLAVLPFGYLLMRTIGFPTPFGLQLTMPVGVAILAGGMWLSWKEQLRVDADAKHNLRKVLIVSVATVLLIVTFLVYNCIYDLFGNSLQVLAALAAPVIKMLFKNWINTGLFHVEDLAPATTVFLVDLFHAVFLATMMQKTTMTAIGATIFVDILQGLVAVVETHTLMKRVLTQVERSHTQLSTVGFAVHLVETNDHTRSHPEIVQPRHVRRSSATSQVATNDSVPSKYKVYVQSGPSHVVGAGVERHAAPSPPCSTVAPPPLEAKPTTMDVDQLTSAKNILQVLHMVEFYVLIEFVEVVAPALYAVYLFIMMHLPNRVYNKQFGHLDDDELMKLAMLLAAIASIELLSLIVFCYHIDRKLQRFSTVRLLAFVLRQDWATTVASLGMWIFFVVQIPLEHFGEDFTLQFKWLHADPPSPR